MKVVVTRTSGPFGADPTGYLKDLRAEFPDVEFVSAETEDDEKEHVREADVFYGWPTRDVFLSAQKLQWIQCPGTGVDRLTEIPELVASDIALTNSRGPHAPPMADHTMGLIVMLAHKLHLMRDDQNAHAWDSRKYHDQQIELAGTTMGILALGDIGSEIAQRANGFGMNVYAADLQARPAPASVKELWGLDRLDELIQMSDWFVVTAPLTDDTRGMIDRRRIGLLKDGAHVIIISRGEIVDEEALAEALRSGRVAGAGIDAFAVEPLAEDSPFWDLKNVVVTPHSSASTPQMTDGRRQIFKENLRRFLNNEPFIYVVNKKAGF